MANNYFKFKQFTIYQDKCAMKVCTDACLFGALVAGSRLPVTQCLDVGTGTGLLPLMLMQKNSSALIDAVEIDADAAIQATKNVAASPWCNNIKIYNQDILTFEGGKKYDCILCNPPFFEGDLQAADDAKNKAKHSSSLSFRQLNDIANKLLSPDGFFTVLLPYHRMHYFTEDAARHGFGLSKQILVKQTEKHTCFRAILFLSRKATEIQYEEIIIKDNNNQYTPEFAAALKDYYLFL